MATSTCMKCGSSSFEIKENSPKSSRFKLMFVQCASCGGVIGAMDYMNIGAELQDVKNAIERVTGQIP